MMAEVWVFVEQTLYMRFSISTMIQPEQILMTFKFLPNHIKEWISLATVTNK